MINFEKKKNLPRIIGVTGTRGKTIVTHLIHHLLKEKGVRVGYLSSIGFYSGDGAVDYGITSHSIKKKNIMSLLENASKSGVEYFILEMSSKKLVNKVYSGIELDSGVITNLYEDSLENYGTIEEYGRTKLSFVEMIKENGVLVANAEEPNTLNFLSVISKLIRKNIYAIKVTSEDISNVNYYLDGTTFVYRNSELIKLRLPANFNVMYALLARAITQTIVDNSNWSTTLEKLQPVAGRLHLFKEEPCNVIIDYAKNPETVREALSHINNTKAPNARVISVLGASSHGTKISREIGKPAKDYSDVVLLTSLDPNTEDVTKINSEIHTFSGDFGSILLERFLSNEEYVLANKEKLKQRIMNIINEDDVPFIAFDQNHYQGRLDAIDLALELAGPNDIVYITGKGHELSTIYDNVEYEWSDYEAVDLILGNKNLV